MPINVEEMNIDLLSASGHKINGPKDEIDFTKQGFVNCYRTGVLQLNILAKFMNKFSVRTIINCDIIVKNL